MQKGTQRSLGARPHVQTGPILGGTTLLRRVCRSWTPAEKQEVVIGGVRPSPISLRATCSVSHLFEDELPL